MRIVTYNILGFQGWPEKMIKVPLTDENGTPNLDYWVELLSKFDADIIGLQEVNNVEEMKYLAKAMNRYLAPLPSPTRYAGCVLSNYPVLETRLFNDSGPRGREGLFSRFGGAGLFDLGDEKAWVINIHLNPHREEIRMDEAELLSMHLDSLLKVEQNAFVLGDFNCQVHELLHQRLKERGFVNTMETYGGGLIPTDWKGTKAIDHIYVSASLKDRVRSAKVVNDPGYKQDEEHPWSYSDHMPVVVELA